MKILIKILAVIITIAIPFFLLMSAIRVLTNAWYPEMEYNAPGFPVDTYGFTLQDRLKWSKISIEYLNNDAGISFLADQKLDAQTPLYNERELSHMADVKNVIKGMVTAWTVLTLGLVAFGIWAWRGKWLRQFLLALSNGGWLTIGLIAIVLVAVVTSFNELFTTFHHLFFVGDTWLFYYSDSLIRLFPVKFWSDGFIWAGCLSVSAALLLGFGGRWLAGKLNA